MIMVYKSFIRLVGLLPALDTVLNGMYILLSSSILIMFVVNDIIVPHDLNYLIIEWRIITLEFVCY